MTTDGQLLIGSTAAPNIRVGSLSSSDSSITVTPGAGTISLTVAGGTTVGKTITGTTGGPLSPTGGNWNILGAATAAGSVPVSTSGAASTLTVDVQISQAIAGTDVTKIGLSAFDSARFSVDANGFVSINGSGVGETITGDSGGALSPSSGNWNIVGLSGAKTSGSGNTLTVKSPPYADASASATSAKNSGEFVTGAFTRTLPASAGLVDGDLIEFVAISAGALVIQSVGAQKIRLGSAITGVAGSLTSTAIGDSVSLRFRATDGFWYATSAIGNWTVSP